jgi:uncharacterized protein (TIGR02996 family)
VLSLLEAAKQSPEDEGPRLVLADWLEDHGDTDRAEFIRLQCRPGPHDADSRKRQDELIRAHGGAWLGPLWNCPMYPVRWHRGLLSCGLPAGLRHDDAGVALAWIDTALFTVNGRKTLDVTIGWLKDATLNHVTLDLRRVVSLGLITEYLSRVPERPSLRTLTFCWSVGMLDRGDGAATPLVDGSFLASLLGLPVARFLTHVGSWPPVSPEPAANIRGRGVEAASGAGLWMHGLRPSCFKVRPSRP